MNKINSVKKNLSRQNYRRRQRRVKRNRFIAAALLVLVGVVTYKLFSKPEQTTITPNTPVIQPPSSPPSLSSVPTQPVNQTDQSVWYLMLVNQDNLLSADYQPNTAELLNGQRVDERIYDHLQNMISDAKQQGLSLVVCSAYRPRSLQEELYQEQVAAEMNNGHSRSEAEKIAGTTVAVPGTSEHQTGLAVDIVALDYQLLDEGVMQTDEVKWLYQNCQKYGFIVRYPEGKSDITKIIYEPWHYRYVGVEAATEIMQRNITLEEYLAERQ